MRQTLLTAWAAVICYYYFISLFCIVSSFHIFSHSDSALLCVACVYQTRHSLRSDLSSNLKSHSINNHPPSLSSDLILVQCLRKILVQETTCAEKSHARYLGYGGLVVVHFCVRFRPEMCAYGVFTSQAERFPCAIYWFVCWWFFRACSFFVLPFCT